MPFIRKFLLSFAIFVVACYLGLTWFVNSEVEKEFNEAIADIEGMTVNYGDIGVDITDQCVSLTDVTATFPQGQHLTAEEVRITSFDQIHPIPHFMKATAMGVTLTADQANVGSWAPTMRALDLGTVKGDLNLDYAYDPTADILTLKTLTLRVPDVGDIDLSGAIDGVELDLFRVEKLLGLRIRDLNFKFANGSFMDTLMRESAKWLSTTKDDAQARISAELTAMADYAGKEDNPIAEDALRGLKRYVNDPNTVTIAATPKEPVPALYFFMGRDMYDNIRLMNVTVTTDSGEDI